MKHASLSLDYFALAKEAKALNTLGAARVFLLGDRLRVDPVAFGGRP
jgi:hypothetical protein